MISVLSKVFYQRSVIDKSCTGQYPRCSSVLVNGKISSSGIDVKR